MYFVIVILENGKPVTKTVVFIDKVLPQSKMSGFEKVHRYQKHALLAALTHRLHAGGIELVKPFNFHCFLIISSVSMFFLFQI